MMRDAQFSAASGRTITIDAYLIAYMISSMTRHHVLEIPVLMYHEIIADDHKRSRFSGSPYAIHLKQFQAQMRHLCEQGYTTITLPNLLQLKHLRGAPNEDNWKKLAVITFDDGYKNNITLALPVLKKYHLVATFFVIVNRIGTRGYLSWSDLRQLKREGMAIQSHTLNHLPLETLSEDLIERELIESKRVIEQQLKRPVDFVSFPHGSYKNIVLEIARRSGFQGCCTSELGFFRLFDDPYRIKRIAIRKNYQLNEFEMILKQNRLFMARLSLSTKIKTGLQGIIGIQVYNRLYRLLFPRR